MELTHLHGSRARYVASEGTKTALRIIDSNGMNIEAAAHGDRHSHRCLSGFARVSCLYLIEFLIQLDQL